jgi:hypothetical protein
MNTRRLWMLLTFVALLGAMSTTPLAHHSTAIYDSDNPIGLRGTVVEWKFSNPHCLIRIEVADASGGAKVWTLEGPNTAGLFRDGWTPSTLKPGDKLVVTVRPLRSGAAGGNYSNVRWADGTPVNPKSGK